MEALKISYWSGQGQSKGLQFASYWNNPGEKQWWLGSGDSSERLNQLRHIKSGSPGDSDSKELACNVGDLGSVLGSGRSPAEGNGNPLQYSCLGNPMDRGAWWATVHGVSKSILAMERYSAFKRKEILMTATARVNLLDIMPSEIDRKSVG